MQSEDAEHLSSIYESISNKYNSISNKPDSIGAITEFGYNIYTSISYRDNLVSEIYKSASDYYRRKSETYNRNYISSLRNFSLLTILFSGDEAPYSDFTYCFTIIASLYSPVVG